MKKTPPSQLKETFTVKSEQEVQDDAVETESSEAQRHRLEPKAKFCWSSSTFSLKAKSGAK